MLLNILFIFLCFFLTSTGYLAWLYHLIDLAPAGTPEILAMGLGYFSQAVGIGLFALILRFKSKMASPKLFSVVFAAYFVCTIPSILMPSLTGTVVFGVFSNVFSGAIAGFYLYHLSKTDSDHIALTFGIGYGLATFASWIMSVIENGVVYQTNVIILICAVLVTAVVFILFRFYPTEENNGSDSLKNGKPSIKKVLIAACSVVFLFSVVNQIGFSFPSSDIENGVNLELSRLFYAVGLIIAGLVSDKNRKHGAVMTLGALVVPFIMLILRKEVVPATLLWFLSYFVSGFFSVYRIILLVDIAKKRHIWFVSGFGLLFGRLGEAFGTVIYTAASETTIVLVVIASLLYAATVVLFFWLYQKMYLPEADREKDERVRFQRFAVKHDLSPREKEILSLLLTKETTASIARQLFVSESTVKFHVHNLLQKTGCKSRKELTELFYTD